eukprot:5055144-Heterocapsa_arctica.AAC.1
MRHPLESLDLTLHGFHPWGVVIVSRPSSRRRSPGGAGTAVWRRRWRRPRWRPRLAAARRRPMVLIVVTIVVAVV